MERIAASRARERAEQAQQLRDIAALVDECGDWPQTAPDGVPTFAAEELAAVEIACALGLSQQTAMKQVCHAVDTCTRLPGAVEALARGVLCPIGVLILAEQTAQLTPEQAAEVLDRVLLRAAGKTLGQLRALVRRAVAAVDPKALIERARRSVADRHVALFPQDDGMAGLWALLPAVDAEHAFHALTALANRSVSAIQDGQPDAEDADDRTLDQRRADTLLDLILRPTAGRDVDMQTHVTIAVPVDPTTGETGVAEMRGHGPIDADTLADLIARATDVRLYAVDAETGTAAPHIIKPSRAYTPGAALARHLRDRDVTCRFPGCRRRAERCDLDHAIPYPEGPTAADNLSCLCRFHHRVKTHTPWGIDLDPDGVVTWTSPTGRRYVTHPWNHLE